MQYLLIILSLFLYSCSTGVTSLSDVQPKGQEISNKIKPLIIEKSNVEKIDFETAGVLESEDNFLTIFKRTLEKNVFANDLDKWGYISIETAYYKNLVNSDLVYLHSLFLFVPTLLGLPFGVQKVEMEFEFTIYNSKREKIKTYIVQGSKKKYGGLYYPNSINHLSVFHDLLRELEEKINSDADYINLELEKASKVE